MMMMPERIVADASLMELTMSMFARSADYWKAQAEAWQAKAEKDLIEIERLRASVAAIHCRLKFGLRRIDSYTIRVLIAECEHAVPALIRRTQ